MGAIDFREILSAKGGEGRDDFELFARAFLQRVGLKPLEGPARGPDGGKDLLMPEDCVGSVSRQSVRWLVSCKHFAHGHQAVGTDDETNINDRLQHHKAQGFVAFYSTVPSAPLQERLKALPTQTLIYDRDRIEERLTAAEPAMRELFKRYFPVSYAKFVKTAREPVLVLDAPVALTCDVCGRDLLKPIKLDDDTPRHHGVIGMVEENDENDGGQEAEPRTARRNRTIAVYAACKGDCDRAMENQFWRSHRAQAGWQDIDDWIIPSVFLGQYMALINGLRAGDTYEENAFARLRTIVMALAQFALREMTPEERERARRLASLPSI